MPGTELVNVQDAIQLANLQRRTLRVLIVGQVVGGAALSSAVTVGAFVIQDILGTESPWAGAATATVTTGTAVMSQVLAKMMLRGGRRPGLQFGYGMAAVGGLVAAMGAQFASLSLFLVGLFIYGSGQASNLLTRYAATDLAQPGKESRAMGSVVFASTFGAVFGPLLIGPAEHAGQYWFGLEKYAGPWLFSAAFFAVATLNVAFRLRPDPLVVAGGTSLGERSAGGNRANSRSPFLAAIEVISAAPRARLALIAMVASQLAMVAVMAMTPVHLKVVGHEHVSQFVVSIHIAGMFAFSPLVGRFSDKRGRLATVLLGSIILLFATVLAGVSGDVEQLLFPSLWALGLGWNFGLIGGSSLLIESVPEKSRVTVQGTADMLMSLAGGVAGLSSGFIRRSLGFHWLAGLAGIVAAFLLVTSYIEWRAAQRGNS